MRSLFNRSTSILCAAFLCFALFQVGCSEEHPTMSKEEASQLSMIDFTGEWQTTLPNGEKWKLILHEDGRFESLPVRSNRGRIDGRWRVETGQFYWKYPGGANTGGVTSEINPIIMKIENKFMLQETMGRKSVYSR